MKAKWLIEKGLFTDTEDNLIECLKKFNIEYKTLPYVPFDDELLGRCEKLFSKDDCVVF